MPFGKKTSFIIIIPSMLIAIIMYNLMKKKLGGGGLKQLGLKGPPEYTTSKHR